MCIWIFVHGIGYRLVLPGLKHNMYYVVKQAVCLLAAA